MQQATSQNVLNLLEDKCGNLIQKSEVTLGDAVVTIQSKGARDFFQLLKLDSELEFRFLADITAVDWLDKKQSRFELVYNLLSHRHLHRLRVKISISEDSPVAESVTSIWSSANFLEREVWDMYGIRFDGHPNLTRILMYPEFEGHPLRKDFPVQGKQPRVQMLNPEVRNTAVDMNRAPLVQISKRSKAA